MSDSRLQEESVLRIGEVSAVTGRRVSVTVDSQKNLSTLFFDGDLIRNIAVGSYIDIRKGFISLIGKVDGENAQLDRGRDFNGPDIDAVRVLSISLVGFLDRDGIFFGGTKELPLVGNEVFLLTKGKLHQVHNLVNKGGIALNIASSEYEGYDVALPVDGLINSHIAISATPVAESPTRSLCSTRPTSARCASETGSNSSRTAGLSCSTSTESTLVQTA